ncbi:PREDICTED: pentatricopeptide repeat-containing protein At1g11290, chloroplastic-like [Nelumbo nucifera]|uniref:Pentatricopeptide repeat-containing protein At1g11290, chloroplastic-like n=2 Tax=Nelumbo nucifera TaxID=4432 RepID=A0A822XJT5_NELNU|nr:PREDICTED: pentatricopeptide repeat-containing protein At1g11290, chloroplastic-like [Nelumbo nucifera]DAD20640.1 TPA_asm: hypothetical protein HUJ06_022103 [Nelumbo nucifera]
MNGVLITIKFFERILPRSLPSYLQIDFYTTQLAGKDLRPPLSSLQCGALLQSFTNTKSYTEGKRLHAYMITSNILFNNTYLNTKLSAFYAICGSMTEARAVFDGIILKNSFLWNCMIRGYACNGFSLNSIVLYREMMSFGQKADNFTYPFVLKACGDLLLVEVGRKIHSELVIRGLESDVYVGNSLLAMYLKFGDMETARRLFDGMSLRDLTSWNTMISGYIKNHESGEALSVFYLMSRVGQRADCTTLLGVLSACADLGALKQGKEIHGFVIRNDIGFSNIFVINSLISMYSHCNSIVCGRRLFDKMIDRDTVSWNSMILGYAQAGDAFESLRLFCQMVSEGRMLDEVTFIGVLGASDQIMALQFGMSVHAYLAQKGYAMDTVVGTALIDMYAKCGSLDCSYRIFEGMAERNLISWSAMITGFGLHGRGREAIATFNEMKVNGIMPDKVTFTSVLSACSHAGLVDEGFDVFYQMIKKYKMKPGVEHYSCMVDLLGRAGRLDDAYEFIKSMEVKPTVDIWASFLSACHIHRNVKLAEIAAQNTFDLNPNGIGPYISLSNIYAAEKRWDNVERVRALMRSKGLKKPPGYSFLELDKVVHRFLVGDKSHPQYKAIYAMLEELNWQLKVAGYKPETSSVFYVMMM